MKQTCDGSMEGYSPLHHKIFMQLLDFEMMHMQVAAGRETSSDYAHACFVWRG
uniref:Uncharacterized protein n=1 Tax=Arundo donax TaxID=35708 RepID=A0A0A9A6X8_ARUDO